MCENEWKNIESAPKDGTKMLVTANDEVWIDKWVDGHWLEEQDVRYTHWMPLPSPPGEAR